MFRQVTRWDQALRVVRRRIVEDDYGDPTTVDSVIGNVRGRFAPAGQVVNVGAPGRDAVAYTDSAAFYLPAGTVVDADDAVVDGAGREWRVTEVAEWPQGVVVKVVSWGQV